MYKVNSEIGKLKKVLLHQPGEEINNLIPDFLDSLLFDDIPWLPLAIKEHQAFSQVFKDHGVEVVYLTDLVAESIENNKEAQEEFINEFVKDTGLHSETLIEVVTEYLKKIEDAKTLVLKTISGIKKTDLEGYGQRTLTDMLDKNPFITNPIPNLYFQRDPFVVIGDGICLNKMYSKTRRRETLYSEIIFKYHPTYKSNKLFYHRNELANIEGGDVLVLSNHLLAIGVSQRTSSQAIEKLAKNLFYNNQTSYDTILCFAIPNQRTFMHLDTVFTQVDVDKFAIHDAVGKLMEVYEIKKDSENYGKLRTRKVEGSVEEILSQYLGRKITLIPCGGGDFITAAREQWSDGANTVAISPGEVITYERNNSTNEVLRSYGIKVNSIPSSELSRGRGGPRCMCMPLEREEIKGE